MKWRIRCQPKQHTNEDRGRIYEFVISRLSGPTGRLNVITGACKSGQDLPANQRPCPLADASEPNWAVVLIWCRRDSTSREHAFQGRDATPRRLLNPGGTAPNRASITAVADSLITLPLCSACSNTSDGTPTNSSAMMTSHC